jgi:pyruvate ferredoxin oxidoreductase gamma subunit
MHWHHSRLEIMQVRIHGRGGQGAVTAAELLSVAAFCDGKWAQAFPSFGSERTGAPVVAYCRISDRRIRTREPVTVPDALIVLDPTLVHQVDLFAGLAEGGWILLNTSKRPDQLGLASVAIWTHLATVAATELAQQHLGRPLPNAVLLGGFAALTGAVSIGSIRSAIGQRFEGSVAEGNIAGSEAAYAQVMTQTAIAHHRELRAHAATD